MVSTSGTRMHWAVAEYPHREDVPRWRWLPSWWRWWPQKDSYWTSMRFADGGVGFVVADTEDELKELMADQIRFYHDDEHCSVGWTWLLTLAPEAAGSPASSASA